MHIFLKFAYIEEYYLKNLIIQVEQMQSLYSGSLIAMHGSITFVYKANATFVYIYRITSNNRPPK